MKQYFENLRSILPTVTGVTFHNGLSQREQKSIKAVVFDVYGTLLTSSSGDINEFKHGKESVLEALKGACVECNGSILDLEFGELVIKEYLAVISETHRELIKGGTAFPEVIIENVWKTVLSRLQQKGANIDFSKTDFHKLALIFEFSANPVYPMPGFKDIITKLHQYGYKLGIVSNAQFYTPMALKYFLGEDEYLSESEIPYFMPELTIFSYKTEHAKPGTHMYKQLAAALAKKSISPAQVLYVGNDMLKDIQPSAELGFKTVLFAGDKRSLKLRKYSSECKNLKPDAVIVNLLEILRILGIQ